MIDWHLDALIAEIRRRGGIAKPPRSSGPSFDPTGDDAMARYANEAQQQAASRVVHSTSGYTTERNAGWFARDYQDTIRADGFSAPWPMDVGKIIGIQDQNRSWFLTRRDQGLSASSGNWGHVRIDPPRLFFGKANAGQSFSLRYNSNLAWSLVKGTASGGSANTLSIASLDFGLQLARTNDYYKFLDAKILSGTGAGQVREISAFDAATATLTVQPDWATPPDATSVFATLAGLPVEAMEYFIYETLLRVPQAAERGRFLDAAEAAWRNMQASILAKEAYQ